MKSGTKCRPRGAYLQTFVLKLIYFFHFNIHFVHITVSVGELSVFTEQTDTLHKHTNPNKRRNCTTSMHTHTTHTVLQIYASASTNHHIQPSRKTPIHTSTITTNHSRNRQTCIHTSTIITTHSRNTETHIHTNTITASYSRHTETHIHTNTITATHSRNTERHTYTQAPSLPLTQETQKDTHTHKHHHYLSPKKHTHTH